MTTGLSGLRLLSAFSVSGKGLNSPDVDVPGS